MRRVHISSVMYKSAGLLFYNKVDALWSDSFPELPQNILSERKKYLTYNTMCGVVISVETNPFFSIRTKTMARKRDSLRTPYSLAV